MIPISGFNPATLRSHIQSAADSLQSALKAIPEAKVELPPRPEGVIRYRDGLFVATECRNPKNGEVWAEPVFPTTPVIGLNPSVAAGLYNGLRWILARRPDAPPPGYEWDEVLPWGALRTKHDSGVFLDGSAIIEWGYDDADSEPCWRCKPKPEPSAFLKAYQHIGSAYYGIPSPTYAPLQCTGDAALRDMWNAFADAADEKFADSGLLYLGAIRKIIAALREPVK